MHAIPAYVEAVAVDNNVDDEWDSALCMSVTFKESFLPVDLTLTIDSCHEYREKK